MTMDLSYQAIRSAHQARESVSFLQALYKQTPNLGRTTISQSEEKSSIAGDALLERRGSKADAINTEKHPDVNSAVTLSIEGKSDMNKSNQYTNGSVVVRSGPQNTTCADTPPSTQPSAGPQRFGQIVDFRAILNQQTKLTSEEMRGNTEQQERLLKPLGGYAGYTSEWRELAMTISREIFLENPNVRWDDIIGLSSAKRLVKEAVVYPIKYPQLFAGILSPWKGLLLYGPPGTGKTLLAKAVATECHTTFFNISASTIVSKWRGDSEKLVRVLFELARFHAPSTIFLDELDSLMSQRGSAGGIAPGGGGGGYGATGGGEHEGSRRMKTELLMQMDGLTKSDDLVFLLAASNLPWELDHAMLRRLEKRILVDLPNTEARQRMFETFLPSSSASTPSTGLQLKCNIDYELVSKLTEGYSGSDIRLVCKEAAMRVVRKIFDILENPTKEFNPETHIRLDPVTTGDVKAAIESTMPSARHLSGRYQEWQRNYGSS
ncbi:katanin p60 ATPase-containing subunit A-like 2 [Clonorchis sinensis]|uniref:Katanin p60 ATPase-containing subunit A-like 2 n=1 Tax=Clonorchis sinensis TaxID=79923 RepID=G7Y8J8_CLOSI|nr:katanin p60 ATPase-containing subunit A-like 2 [Clonorchis sinensis]